MAGWIAPVLGALGIGASIYGAKKAGDVADVSQDYYNASAEQIRQAIDLINKSSAVLQPYLTQGSQLYSAIQPINYALLGLLPQAGQMQPTNIQSALGPTELQYALGQVPTGTTPTQEAPPAGLTAEDLAYLVSMLQKIGSGTTAQTPTTPATLPPLWQDIVPQTPSPTTTQTRPTGKGEFNLNARSIQELLGLPFWSVRNTHDVEDWVKAAGLPTGKTLDELKKLIKEKNLKPPEGVIWTGTYNLGADTVEGLLGIPQTKAVYNSKTGKYEWPKTDAWLKAVGLPTNMTLNQLKKEIKAENLTPKDVLWNGQFNMDADTFAGLFGLLPTIDEGWAKSYLPLIGLDTNLTLDQVKKIIQRENIQPPSGLMWTGDFNWNAKNISEFLGIPPSVRQIDLDNLLKRLGLPSGYKNTEKGLAEFKKALQAKNLTSPGYKLSTIVREPVPTQTATGAGTAGATTTSGGTTETGTGTTATSQQVPPNLTAEELNNLVAILNKVTPTTQQATTSTAASVPIAPTATLPTTTPSETLQYATQQPAATPTVTAEQLSNLITILNNAASTTQQATTGSAPGEAQIPALNADLIANLGATGTTGTTGTSYKPAGTTVNGLPAGTPTFSAEYIQALQNVLGSAPWMNPTEVPTVPTLPQGQYGQLMENVPKPSDIGYQIQQSYNTLANKDLADLAAQRQQAISSYMARQGLGGSTMDISKNLGLENWYNTQKALMAAQGTQARLEAERQARAEQQNRADLLRGWDLESYDKEVTRMLTQQALAERQQQASKQNFFDLLNYLNQQATGMMGLGDMTGTAGNLLGAASGLANVGSGVAGLIPDTSSFWTGLGQLFAQKSSSTPATTVNVGTQPTSTTSSAYKPIYPWSVINSPLYGG